MKLPIASGVLAGALALATPVCAHRIDEYLQATIISLEPDDTVSLTLRLVPGVAVASTVLESIDRGAADGVSPAARDAYVRQVWSDLSVAQDGRPLTLRAVDASFAPIARLRAGTGEIRITYSAWLFPGHGAHRLTFDNHHHRDMSVYLVNAVEPDAARFHIESQSRNASQSSYELNFTDSGPAGSSAAPSSSSSGSAGASKRLARHGLPLAVALTVCGLAAWLLAFIGSSRTR